MKTEDFEDLLLEVQDELQEYVYAMDKLRDFDIYETESKIRTLWKNKKIDRTDNLTSDNINNILNELNIIDSVSKDCGEVEDLINADLEDFGYSEEDI